MAGTKEEFDRAFSIAESMIVDDLKMHVRDAMVVWGWAVDHGDSYELTDLGLRQLSDRSTREVLVHFNVDVPSELNDDDAGKRAVDDLFFTARSGEREAFEGMIALVDPT